MVIHEAMALFSFKRSSNWGMPRMHRRDGARKIDSRKSKKEKRLARLKSDSQIKGPPVRFKECEDGHWQVTMKPRRETPTTLIFSEIKEKEVPSFDVRGFLEEVKAAINRRKLTETD
jgi:hypothetical protein